MTSHLRLLRAAARAVVVFLFAAIVVVVFAQVVSRFVFNAPFSWSEELARYLQVWLILLASAACVRRGLHLTVDYAVHSLGPRLEWTMRFLSLAGVIFFLGVVIVSGIVLISATANQMTPALEIPIRIVYLALPIGALLMLFEALALAGEMLASRRDHSGSPDGTNRPDGASSPAGADT
ncbi:MAG TPA: TRAP transporter small permease [Acidobacteriota bacterium]|nr:TRAP transporter small permease [Acidobacteriota bacterium]